MAPTVGTGSSVGFSTDRAGGRWPYGGFALLPFVVESGPGRPATDATWSWTLRRFGRAAVWLLPAYAIVYGSVTLVGSGSAPFVVDRRPGYLLGWIGALWLGVLALMALTSLLATTRARAIATAGLLVGVAGMMLLLPYGGFPGAASDAGTAGRVIALTGAALYSLGWFLSGLALFRSGVFSQSDGSLLMIAAPLLGAGGMLAAALHGLGAMFALAAGIGVAWRAGRLAPRVGRARLVKASTAGAVAASVAAGAARGVAATGPAATT
ncbi:hypothetical protein [Plantactinospora sp. CA-290183]|uniref:hypothetical protein n=1 Tax=Plantactinospora sp. CA-290183 TaxID=3240006 RepID=UPI003D8A57D8